MPQAVNELTPMDATVEERLITFDFGKSIDPGVVLTSVVDVTCDVVQGVDPDAQSRIKTTPAIVDSAPMPAGTGRLQAAASVLVGNMVAGVTYLLQCVVTTSDGQELSVWQHLECLEPH